MGRDLLVDTSFELFGMSDSEYDDFIAGLLKGLKEVAQEEQQKAS
jgi:hypothetical protein